MRVHEVEGSGLGSRVCDFKFWGLGRMGQGPGEGLIQDPKSPQNIEVTKRIGGGRICSASCPQFLEQDCGEVYILVYRSFFGSKLGAASLQAIAS